MAQLKNPTRPGRFRDQHGRLYDAVIEAASGHPTGPVLFLHRTPNGHLPPWVPSDGDLDFDPLEQGRVTVAYDRVIGVIAENLKDWERAVRDAALKLYADKAGDVLADLDALPPALLQIHPKPQTPDLIEACRQGNKWALGFTDAVPGWARKLVAGKVAGVKAPAKEYPDADEEDSEAPEPSVDGERPRKRGRQAA